MNVAVARAFTFITAAGSARRLPYAAWRPATRGCRRRWPGHRLLPLARSQRRADFPTQLRRAHGPVPQVCVLEALKGLNWVGHASRSPVMASVNLRISGVTPANEIRRLAASNCGRAPVQSVRARAMIPGGGELARQAERARFRGPRCRPQLDLRAEGDCRRPRRRRHQGRVSRMIPYVRTFDHRGPERCWPDDIHGLHGPIGHLLSSGGVSQGFVNAGLLPAREADRQCFRRGVQQPGAGGVHAALRSKCTRGRPNV